MAKSPMDAEKARVESPIDLEMVLDAVGGMKTRPVVSCSLTRREMDSLTAISDTLLPSINVAAPEAADHDHDQSLQLGSFYHTSASMLGSHEATGEHLVRLRHKKQGMLRVALWLLSTWFGALVLCGAMNVSSSFPYIHKFSDLHPERREEIVLWWANNPFYLYRMLFRALKFMTTLSYFTQVNEKGENPTWKALGYCGPDPEHIKKKQQQQQQQQQGNVDRLGPLHPSLVYMNNSSKDTLSSALSQCGLSLSLSATTPPSPSPSPSPRPRQKPVPTIQCDAVIVGSGSGGGVVAGVLAQAGYKVVVLEKGSYRARSELTLLEGQSIQTMYEGGGLLATDDTGVVILAGSTVGGGSSINWSASLRTPDHVVFEWRNEHGLELFGSDAYEAASNAVCERMGVQAEVDDDNLNNSVVRRGCCELGYPVKNIPRNSAPDHSCGWCCFGCRDGRKKGVCETWLADLADSGNGVILPGCRAVKVLHESRGRRRRNVATGVVFEHDTNGCSGDGRKGTCVVEARVTVVACGALNTPVLLKRSGLRNANIGKNLHLHPVVMAWGYFPESGKKSYEGGIMTAMSPVSSSSSSSSFKYGAIIQTPSLHPGMFSVVTPWTSGADYKERMGRFAQTAHVFTLARDRGSGAVDSRGSISYEMGGADEDNLKKGIEKTLRILAAAGAVEIGTHHQRGDRLNVKSASSHEFERFVKEASGRGLKDSLSTPVCSAHQMGSCRMGVDPETSAVDQKGETWEVEGLFVADSSVFPTALGVNPMVTVQAIAYCTAHSVLELLRRKIKRRSRSRRRAEV